MSDKTKTALKITSGVAIGAGAVGYVLLGGTEGGAMAIVGAAIAVIGVVGALIAAIKG